MAPERTGERMTEPRPEPAVPAPRQRGEVGLDPLHCVEVVELVTDYLDGVLTPDEVARLDAHLALCDPCVQYIEQVRQTIRATGRVEPEAVPPEVLDRLLHVYRELRGT